MYYHANLKILALLMLYFTVSCSASKLEHFKDIFTEEDATLSFAGIRMSGMLIGLNLNEAAARCSEVCYRRKYFCDLFIIVDEPDTTRTCYLYNSRTSSFSTSQLGEGRITRAIYQLSERKDIEPLEKRFSYDHKVTLDDWIANIQAGYSLSAVSIPTNVLTCSVKAMNSKPPTPIDFDKWIISKNVSQSWRMPFELHNSSGWKIMEAVKVWEQFINGSKQVPIEYFDTLMLTFLDIFCPFLQEGIMSVYDPVKKVVFITKEDLHILVVSYGPGDFALVRSKDNFQWPKGNPLVYVSNPRRRERDTPGNPVELFQQATSNTFSNPIYKVTSPSSDTERITAQLEVLSIVVVSLSPSLFPWVLTGPSFIFYGDLITAVLSSVYRNYRRPIFTSLKSLQTRYVFGDISVSTFHESE